jgi:hypothetical protein
MCSFTGPRVSPSGRTEVRLEVGGKAARATLVVCEHLAVDLIVGMDLLRSWSAIIDATRGVTFTELGCHLPWHQSAFPSRERQIDAAQLPGAIGKGPSPPRSTGESREANP